MGTSLDPVPLPREPHGLRRAARAQAMSHSRASRRAWGSRHGTPAPARRSFHTTMTALDALASGGANVAIHVADLDTAEVLAAGDDHVVLPVGGLGVVPLLIETADAFASGRLDPDELVKPEGTAPARLAGIWQHLASPPLALDDVAVLASLSGDAAAANVLLRRVGIDVVNRHLAAWGFADVAILDVFRDHRGPDDAPYFALGSARAFARMLAALVDARLVSAAVSAQVAAWLNLHQDFSLVGSATGLDPFAHDDDPQRLLFVHKTGRETGVRAEAGVLAGPRAGAAYALIVRFEESTVLDRLRVHDAFRRLGTELMEYVH